ncbi:PREDICTED: macrophage colony-stimulating factor 1 [Crocodylus porosus]|nr:PREDICTED: macrophage colony-stimulating factor 1 [Crocodylus porosus]
MTSSISLSPAKTHLIPRAWLALLFVACCWTQKGDYCNQIITDKHLNELQDLIDTQMMNACKVSFEYIDEQQLNKPICFVKAAFPQLKNILDKMVYKKNSSNFEKANNVREMYTKIDENEEICIEEQDEEEKELSQACVKEFSTPPEEMLGLVKKFFSKVKDLLDQKVDFRQDCSDTYRKLCSASKKQETSSLGVAAQNCNCPTASPIPGRPSTSLPPASVTKPFPSTVARQGSEEFAAGTHPPHSLPDTLPTPTKLDGSIRPQAFRSTHSSTGTRELLGPWAGTSATTSSPPAESEPVPASQGHGDESTSNESLQDPAEAVGQEPPSTKGFSISPPSSAPDERMLQRDENGFQDPFLSSRAGSMQLGLAGHGKLVSASPNPLPVTKRLHTRAVEDATSAAQAPTGTEPSDHLMEASSIDATSSPGPGSVEAEDALGLAYADSPGTPLLSELSLGPTLSSKEPISVAQHQFSRMAATTDNPTPPEKHPWESPWHPAGQGRGPGTQHIPEKRVGGRIQGLSRFNEPDDSMAGPQVDLNFIPPNTDRRRKEAKLKESNWEPLIYTLAISILAVLLAVGGLLFYMHKSRTLERQLQMRGNDLEQQEGRLLHEAQACLQLQVQREL